jgi:hypothetical protein
MQHRKKTKDTGHERSTGEVSTAGHDAAVPSLIAALPRPALHCQHTSAPRHSRSGPAQGINDTSNQYIEQLLQYANPKKLHNLKCCHGLTTSSLVAVDACAATCKEARHQTQGTKETSGTETLTLLVDSSCPHYHIAHRQHTAHSIHKRRRTTASTCYGPPEPVHCKETET